MIPGQKYESYRFELVTRYFWGNSQAAIDLKTVKAVFAREINCLQTPTGQSSAPCATFGKGKEK